jgi:hypothetical protein
MRKNLQARQEMMKQRQFGRLSSARPIQPAQPTPTWTPVDYSNRVEYSSDVTQFQHWPRSNGVYLLAEGGRYYIGQSIDVAARFASHRLKPINCKFVDPRCVLLATVPLRDDVPWSKNTHVRLNAEARFIAAALGLDMPLTNSLSEFKRGKLRSLFPDVRTERERLEKAIQLLC